MAQVPNEFEGLWKSPDIKRPIISVNSYMKSIFFLNSKGGGMLGECSLSDTMPRVISNNCVSFVDGIFTNNRLLQINSDDDKQSIKALLGPGAEKFKKSIVEKNKKIIASWKQDSHPKLRIGNSYANDDSGRFLIFDNGHLYEINYSGEGQPPNLDIEKYSKVTKY
jgi:hypothetical protein